MAYEFFDYDPLTGITEYVEWSADGSTFSLRTEQDVEPVVDTCKFLANTGGTERNFRGEGWLYASLPLVALMQMKKKGFDALGNHGREGTKYLLREINTNYPVFKTTHRHHAIK
jgi:hypothetical protein